MKLNRLVDLEKAVAGKLNRMTKGLWVRLHVPLHQDEDDTHYAIALHGPVAEAPDEQAAGADAAVPAVRIMVLEGNCRRRIHEFKLERINLGRLDCVEGRGPGRLRHNQVAFLGSGDPINSTVSRAHARIEYFASEGFRVIDDGSVNGTRILREGRCIPVARMPGARLCHGDEIELGVARVLFLTE
jgi:hypothetical protein